MSQPPIAEKDSRVAPYLTSFKGVIERLFDSFNEHLILRLTQVTSCDQQRENSTSATCHGYSTASIIRVQDLYELVDAVITVEHQPIPAKRGTNHG